MSELLSAQASWEAYGSSERFFLMSSMIRIVIAEDNPELRELFAEQLRCVRDFEVTAEACDGREAIAAVSRLDPDILILDLDLPRIDGLEVLQVVRWFSPGTKVIVHTGHSEEATILTALELGARGYIVKGDRAGMEKAIRAVQRGEVWARRRELTRILSRLVSLYESTFGGVGTEPAPA